MKIRLPGFSRLYRWATRSISHKLLLAFFAVFFGTYLITAAVVLTGVRTSVADSERGSLSQLANFKLNSLNNRFDQLAVNLQAWSKLDVMNDLPAGDVDQRIRRALREMKSDYSLQGTLYAFNAAGKLVASSGDHTRGTQLPADWQPRHDITFIDQHTNPLGYGRIVALAAPVHSAFAKGFDLGTLVLTYPWPAIRKELGTSALLVRASPDPAILDTTLTDGRRVDLQKALTAVDDDATWVQVGNQEYMAQQAVNPAGALLSHWEVVTFRSSEALDRTLGKVALQLLGLWLVIAIPLILIIRFGANRLSAPARQLTDFVSEITETGDLSRRLTPSSRDELGTLTGAFNTMTERLEAAAKERERFVRELEQAAQDLELKVEERTAELTEANAELSRILSELQSAQSQLIQQEKMASLGQLVAGVAHELNNPIGFIYANFPHLEEYVRDLLALIDTIQAMPLPEPVRTELAARIEEADLDFIRDDLLKIIRSGQSGASRIKEIISSLRSFSRLDEAVEKSVRLEDGLDDTLALLHHHLQKQIEIERDYRLGTEILCNPGRLNQVFMNILYNAIQAIDGPGTIRVTTRREEDWAVVEIADSGPGIPSAVVDRIFDPFFTTKKVGEGTGLGLSISYGIVQEHGGRIDVHSAPGQGTTFIIRIPIAS